MRQLNPECCLTNTPSEWVQMEFIWLSVVEFFKCISFFCLYSIRNLSLGKPTECGVLHQELGNTEDEG